MLLDVLSAIFCGLADYFGYRHCTCVDISGRANMIVEFVLRIHCL